MSKVPTNYEDWVKACIKALAIYFNLQGWSIHLIFSDQVIEDDIYAQSEINSSYMDSTITLFSKAKEEFNNKTLDGLVVSLVHELVHILLDPLHECMDPFLSKASTPAYINILEQQTQKITRIFLKNVPIELLVLLNGVLNEELCKEDEVGKGIFSS